MSYRIKEIRYSDLSFTLAQTETGDIKTADNVNAIRQSLYNVLYTKPGTRVMRPDYGINLERYLFEMFDNFTADAIAEHIINSLEKYEPRIYLHNVNVTLDHIELAFIVDITYSIRNTATVDTLSIILKKT